MQPPTTTVLTQSTPIERSGNGRSRDQTPSTPTNGQANGDAHVHNSASFAELLEQYEYPEPQRGQVFRGHVMRITDDALYINIGAKRDAIVPYDELEELDEQFLEQLERGDELPVYVTRTPVGDDELIVSLKQAWQREDWLRAEQFLEDEKDTILDLEVVEYNKGGLLVQFGHLRGFVPNSHVPDLRRTHDPDQRRSLKSQKIGDTLPVKVLEVDRQRERLVLSATAAHKEQRRHQLEALQEGSVMTGTVTHIVDYGAFVNLGAVDGLVHISKLDWSHVDHPSDVVSVGDEIEVLIEKVNVDRERISLNHKALQPTPWDEFVSRHEVGDLVEGAVTNTVDFGAFVQMPSGVEGLVHISEMNMRGADHPSEVLEPGQEVLVRIISIEPDRERLGLSQRRVTATEEITWMNDRRLTEMAGDEVENVEEEE